jgi:hypothetical protein
MTFCDRATVRRMFEGKSVALVGSGPGSLDNPKGLVDSHDVVIRANNYKLFPATGKRTDVHYSFYGRSIRKTARELQRDGVKLCMCKCPDAKFMESEWHTKNGKLNGVDFRYIYELRKGWWFTDTYVPSVAEFMEHFDLLGGHVATTGFAALLDVLSYNPERVFMTGFDFFASKLHNVNERWKKLNPDDPIGHVPDVERAWFKENYDRFPITMDARLSAAVA